MLILVHFKQTTSALHVFWYFFDTLGPLGWNCRERLLGTAFQKCLFLELTNPLLDRTNVSTKSKGKIKETYKAEEFHWNRTYVSAKGHKTQCIKFKTNGYFKHGLPIHTFLTPFWCKEKVAIWQKILSTLSFFINPPDGAEHVQKCIESKNRRHFEKPTF